VFPALVVLEDGFVKVQLASADVVGDLQIYAAPLAGCDHRRPCLAFGYLSRSKSQTRQYPVAHCGYLLPSYPRFHSLRHSTGCYMGLETREHRQRQGKGQFLMLGRSNWRRPPGRHASWVVFVQGRRVIHCLACLCSRMLEVKSCRR
jgi:hypothetical protein